MGAQVQELLRAKLREMVDEELDRIHKILLRKTSKDEITARQRQKMAKVSTLINNVNNTIKAMDSDSRRRNFQIDKSMFAERLKQDHMFDVTKELETLSGQKIQFLKHNFSQVKTQWKDTSETEMQSKLDYEDTRMSKFMAHLVAKEREKRNQEMSKNIKLLKAIKTT